MTQLEVADLCVSYGGRPVLRDVDLTVPSGSLTAVLGPSGCGKTTLLRVVAGFLRPDRGEVRLDGRTVATPAAATPPARRAVAYVPQEGALFPHLTVAENVLFGLPRPDRRARAGLADLLALVDLETSVADRLPAELSGGQQQRVALARALAVRPRLVLLDEPFSSLDAALREETGRTVARALRGSGATALLVTHDQAEALSLADQVAVLRDGRVAQVAAPQDLYRYPVDPGVAAFVGSGVVVPGRAAAGTVACVLGMLHPLDPHVEGAVQVLVRPEQLEVYPEVPDGVPARVVGTSFYGHDATVRLRVEGVDEEVLARVHGELPAPGRVVTVRVSGAVHTFRGA